MSSGAAPFYDLQSLHEAQGAPSDPTGAMTQFDTQSQPMDFASAQAAQGYGPAPQTPPYYLGAPQPQAPPVAMQPTPPQPQPAMGPPASPMGPAGPMQTPPPSGDLSATVPDLATRLAQYRAMTDPVYARMKQPLYGTNVPRPSGVAQFFSMGQISHEWAARASQHDAQAQAYNNSLDLQSLQAAQKLMAADSTAQLAQARFGLEQNRFTLESLRAQTAANEHRLAEEQRALHEERDRLRFAFQYPTPAGAAPSAPPTGAPGVPASEGAAPSYAPPAPGSPLAESAGGAPATSPMATAATSAASSSAMRPGEDLYTFGQRRKAELKPPPDTTSSTRAMQEAAPKVRSLADEVEKDLNAIDTGPLASRYHEFTAGTLGISDPAWMRYRTNTGLLQTLLMRMHTGARGSAEMMKKFKDLIDSGRQSPENMRAALAEIRRYADEVEGKTTTTTPTQPTTPSTAPAGEAGDGFQTTPGGRRFRIVQ